MIKLFFVKYLFYLDLNQFININSTLNAVICRCYICKVLLEPYLYTRMNYYIVHGSYTFFVTKIHDFFMIFPGPNSRKTFTSFT